ncbi:1-deoxy-D-xylulose-5-phosphate reductoisomerase [Benzoatithermus flavus]|uniref:1-deoxy-D-xylulose 5-phosphate reductoisomerase n=1 Tax=Benzoatithermus flavus TaxID=3108223 RepID=A0ABU8XKA7_9PROT
MSRRLPPSSDRPRSITILGATGSIGRSTLALVAEAPELYRVEAVTAWQRADELAAVARSCSAKLAVIGDERCYPALKERLAGTRIEVAAGMDALVEAAERPAEWVMAAIVGAAGLRPTLAAVRRGAMVALANKECLVCAGALLMREVARHEAVLLPVDSEHNAIWQALAGSERSAVRRLILTASGGPFRRWSLEAMAKATPEQAVSHPNWSMGAKISVDSATMMNKGLEIIEAHHLFGVPEEAIEVVVHPQSIVHSLVSFKDGSLLAQLGEPDMRIPIAYTLGWPARLATTAPELDLCARSGLDFEPPDLERFPALRLARLALRQGGAAPTILNAANEVAVAAFLARRIGFLGIARTVGQVLERLAGAVVDDLDAVVAYDAEARRMAAAVVATIEGCGPS